MTKPNSKDFIEKQNLKNFQNQTFYIIIKYNI